MHVPDGFINGATSASAAVAAAGGVGMALRQVRQRLLEQSLALAGLVAAFVFAAQMVNFPVVAGTSGHLIGAALAAILVGPSAAIVVMSSVLVVQSLLFADGGLTALGINLLNMAVLAPLAAWLLFRIIVAVAGGRRSAVIPATALAAWASVVVASIGFTVQYAVGGHGDAPIATVLAAMVGIHSLIGIGEAVITVMVVRAVLTTRPDLVREARGTDDRVGPTSRQAVGLRVGVAGMVAALVVAAGVSQFSSGAPDGLERVAIDNGFAETGVEHTLSDRALADYGDGFEDEAAGTAASGLVGTVAVLGIAMGGLWAATRLLRRTRAELRTVVDDRRGQAEAEA